MIRWQWIIVIVVVAILIGWGISFAVSKQGIAVKLGKASVENGDNAVTEVSPTEG